MNELFPAMSDDAELDREPTTRTHEARLWRDNGWTARVIKNGDDDGWAVEMIQDGQDEPALVGPWTMGRDKKNPKPLDSTAFITLIKTASEVLRRHEQQLHALLHKNLIIDSGSGRLRIALDIVPDEYEPYAELSAHDGFGEELARVRVLPGFKLSRQSAADWIANGFARPA
ncbi:MAG: hypothetical protein L0H29_11760 [Sinobacteraceae bacterium]|nr:hypothetical protein [Nevskiaceae bacterium]